MKRFSVMGLVAAFAITASMLLVPMQARAASQNLQHSQFQSRLTSSEFSQQCAHDPNCYKLDFSGEQFMATVSCPVGQVVTQVTIHAGLGQTIFEYTAPSTGDASFTLAYSNGGRTVTVTDNTQHALSYVAIECGSGPIVFPADTGVLKICKATVGGANAIAAGTPFNFTFSPSGATSTGATVGTATHPLTVLTGQCSLARVTAGTVNVSEVAASGFQLVSVNLGSAGGTAVTEVRGTFPVTVTAGAETVVYFTNQVAPVTVGTGTFEVCKVGATGAVVGNGFNFGLSPASGTLSSFSLFAGTATSPGCTAPITFAAGTVVTITESAATGFQVAAGGITFIGSGTSTSSSTTAGTASLTVQPGNTVITFTNEVVPVTTPCGTVCNPCGTTCNPCGTVCNPCGTVCNPCGTTCNPCGTICNPNPCVTTCNPCGTCGTCGTTCNPCATSSACGLFGAPVVCGVVSGFSPTGSLMVGGQSLSIAPGTAFSVPIVTGQVFCFLLNSSGFVTACLSSIVTGITSTAGAHRSFDYVL